MMNPVEHGFLSDLVVVLCVAALTSVVFRKLRQPAVLGYLLAGLIVGPYIPIPLVADLDRVHIFSELGVVLVMFAIGLEFSFRKIKKVGVQAGLIALIQISVMFWLGYLAGGLLNYSELEKLYAGAIISISSTMIIVKAFQDRGIGGKLASIVFGVLIVEDIFAILILAVLSAMTSTSGQQVSIFGETLRLILFFAALVGGGIVIVPRTIRYIAGFNSPETLTVASIGICFGFALIAQKAGYSVALGSFVAGMLVAESGHATRIEHLIQPLKDVFAAIFFVSVGMLMNPAELLNNWQSVLLLTVIVITGKAFSVFIGAFLSGNDLKTSVQAGMSMAQIGEFSFILAAAGLASGAIGDFLYPVAIAICVITTFTTPGLIASSGKIATWLDQHLPYRLQTFVTLYSTWVDRLNNPTNEIAKKRKRVLWILAVDIFVFALIVNGFSLMMPKLIQYTQRLLPLEPARIMILLNIVRFILVLPFLVSIIRCARSFGTMLSQQALPAVNNGKLDLAEAPRRTLLITLEVSIVLIAAIVMISIIQPFVATAITISILVMIVFISIFLFWKETAQLAGHFRAGAEVIAGALMPSAPQKEQSDGIQKIKELLPGLGTVTPVRISATSTAAGKSLKELNLRGLSGATVIAIVRGSQRTIIPDASEVLHEGDVAALIGSDDAVIIARQILSSSDTVE